MARAGDELVDPIAGERMIFRKTAKETDGELLQLDWIGKAGWTAGPLHVHPYQEERLEIMADPDGVWRCRTTFNCVEACPRDIKITKAILEVTNEVGRAGLR